MADTKISAAADITSLNATDMLPVARSGSTTAYHATMAEMSTFANNNLPTASTSVLGAVKVDGSTVTIAGGTISTAASSTSVPAMDGTGAAGSATAWSRGDHVHPTDVTRAPLASPTFTGTPAAPTPTTGDNSTKLATTAFVQSQLVASGAGVSTFNTRAGAVVLQQSDITAVGALNDVGRNLIHNAQFNVQQRGAGPFTTSLGYTADRWVPQANTDTISYTIVALADADRTAIGDEAAAYTLQNVFTGNAAAAAFNELTQRIEGVRRLSGKTVTLSFWAKASAALRFGAALSTNFGSGGSPSTGSNVTLGAVTLTTGWARYSLTGVVPSSAGMTFGTNGNDFVNVRFGYSSGANNNALWGNTGVQSGTVNLWGVQLEIGSVATPLARRDPVDDLALCQRFYTVIPQAGAMGYGAATYQVQGDVSLPVTMRAAPSVVFANTGYNNASGVVLVLSYASHVRWGFAVTTTGNANAATDLLLSADL